jgi:tRNA dimethylallyltransferase
VVAIFGPTGVGKTDVAIELAALLGQRGEDPIAISCDAIQIYRGLEALSGAPSAAQRARLEHRFVAFVDVREEFSAGRFAELAKAEIDAALARGRRPLVVGGTGLYMRAALAELELQPPVEPRVRELVERELSERGPRALHAELAADVAARIHPNDRKRIARALELQRSGLDPPERGEELWTARLRHPSRLFGLLMDRGLLAQRIGRRVDAMVSAGAAAEARRADSAGAARTARAALGFTELLAGDVEAMKAAHRRYARRQLTWMRRMRGVERIDVGDRSAAEVAAEIAGSLPWTER